MRVNFERDCGAHANDNTLKAALVNRDALNVCFANLHRGDELWIPNKTFHLMGGVQVHSPSSIIFRIDGTLVYSDATYNWPRDDVGRVYECMHIYDASNFTITSNAMGIIDGHGSAWWGIVGYLIHKENRPRLMTIESSTNVLIEHILLRNSPYWTFWAPYVDTLEIRHTTIDARRTQFDGHSFFDITAFNTDGFDVTGKNVHIHDCNIWNQDDTIAVKGGQDMLFENIHASGVGLSIGSIGTETVQNVTFRNIVMHRPYKGIYIKFNGNARRYNPGRIQDVVYENILIENPIQWGIWIGPAQQSDTRHPCYANPCSPCWPLVPWSVCNVPKGGVLSNITLRNITITNPHRSPGVLMASQYNRAKNVTFDNVRVVNSSSSVYKLWGTQYYKCQHFDGVATGDTFPVPDCFTRE